MPNHCTNDIRIRGDKDKIDRLFKKLVKVHKDGTLEVDFNAVKPMPKILERVVSPTEVVATKEEADKKNAEWNKDNTKALRIRAITQQQQLEWKRRYGADNWYDWAIKNWGTKWNAYDTSFAEKTSDTSIQLAFCTAWGPPDGVIKELEQQGFEVDGYWQEEGGEEGYIGNDDEVYVRKEVEFL